MPQDTALPDDPSHLSSDSPATPAERLNVISTILAEGIRRRRRQLTLTGLNADPSGGSPIGLDLLASPCPDGSAG